MVRESRFEATKVFLTYQHIEREPSLNNESLKSHFNLVLPPLLSYTIGTESYPSEPGEHIHVLLRFTKKERFLSSLFTFLSIVPYSEKFRGHSKKDVLAVHVYCKKEGAFITNVEDTDFETKSNQRWSEILQAPTRDEATSIFQSAYPRDAILSRRQFDYWADLVFKVIPPAFIPREGFINIPDVLSSWYETNVLGKFFYHPLKGPLVV